MAILDCRDTRISLWQDGDALHSPGVVTLENGEYHFGDAALERFRLLPRDSNSRFWWQLSTQALKPALGAARHTADLVHSHLRHIHSRCGAPDELVLAVPGSMPPEQLSLLLGVAQASDFSVSGLVSRSVLIASTCMLEGSPSRVLHLEAQLNQTIVNELLLENGQLRITRSTPLPAAGLLALQERCMSAIASAFIQQTRFDPRRSAASEQQLYNQLPQLLSALSERGEASIDIDGHRARVTSSALATATERLLTGLEQARPDAELPILLDPELQWFPGVSSLAGDVRALADDALWSAFTVQRERLESGGDDVHLIDRLPPAGSTQPAPVASAPEPPATEESEEAAAPDVSGGGAPAPQPAAEKPGATHVLLGTRALPLRGSEIRLGDGFALRMVDGHWTVQGEGALINGMPSSPRQPLVLGDTLSLGSAGHGRLIEVQD